MKIFSKILIIVVIPIFVLGGVYLYQIDRLLLRLDQTISMRMVDKISQVKRELDKRVQHVESNGSLPPPLLQLTTV